MTTRHFLSLLDFTSEELRGLIEHAIDVKQKLKQGIPHTPLDGKLLAMIFEKSSTRTRVSFEAGMYQLGGHAMFLSPRDSQLGAWASHQSRVVMGRGEPRGVRRRTEVTGFVPLRPGVDLAIGMLRQPQDQDAGTRCHCRERHSF